MDNPGLFAQLLMGGQGYGLQQPTMPMPSGDPSVMAAIAKKIQDAQRPAESPQVNPEDLMAQQGQAQPPMPPMPQPMAPQGQMQPPMPPSPQQTPQMPPQQAPAAPQGAESASPGQSPMGGFFNRMRPGLAGFGAALAANNPAAGIPYMQQQGAMASKTKLEEQQKAQKQAQTKAAADKMRAYGRNDLAAAVENGFPVEDAWKLILKKDDLPASAQEFLFAQKNPEFGEWLVKKGGSEGYGTTPMPIRDPDGNLHVGQLYKGGGVFIDGELRPGIPKGWAWEARPSSDKFLDLGPEFAPVNPVTGARGPSIEKDLQEAERQKQLGTETGKREGAAPERKIKAISAFEDLNRQHAIVKDEISQAASMIQESPNMTTGLVGGLAKAVPGTDAYTLAKKIETIKANIGFDKLQSMRENSPTGGALGQVSDFENRQLQSVMGSLEQAQDAKTILYNLQRLQAILESGEASRQDAYRRDFGETPQLNEAPQFGAGKPPGGQTSNGVKWSIE